MSALSDAISRSFSAGEPERPAVSPLRALGRRRLSGIEVLAQSVATTAPAASMVVLPMTVLRYATPLTGVLTILGATILIFLIALCVTRFTRRQAAAGGLYSFVFQGLGTRAALTTGVAILAKYVGSATLTLYSGTAALSAVLGELGVDVTGHAATVAVHAAVAAVALAVLVRGARFAALALLAVEAGSLLFIVALTLLPPAGPAPPAPTGAPHGLLYVALAAVFALAGFESATFFGPEAKRPLVTITRTVLLTPLICGGLFVFAAWAAWTGRATTLVEAYLHGTASGASAPLVIALNLGLTCSWLASATASSHAASRLVYSMGVERLLPPFLTAVHHRFRTPYAALLCIVLLVTVASALSTAVPVADTLRTVVRAMVVAAYVLVAVASIRFLRRIREQTPGAVGWALVASLAGTALLAYLLVARVVDADVGAPAVIVALLSAGAVWHRHLRRRRPGDLTRVGAFDCAESADVLPGAGVFAPDAHGNPVLVAGRAPPRRRHPQREAPPPDPDAA
ncbi:APC family permease [Pseudonocardia xinjiangensis]|uniref:APC family permease n=1 Tax=Pseudonocardia xinjiangensis TaxID=75289 RepID=UPI003D94C955